MGQENPYDQKYNSSEFYWGKTPSAMCDKVIGIIGHGENFHPKLIDLGCGEGRNAVYFARHGFDVVGIDSSLPGIEKTKKYAEEASVRVDAIQADIIQFELKDLYQVIFSTGTLHYIPPETRERCFQNFRDHTVPNGINALNVLVEKPFIPRAPDAGENGVLYKSGELFTYYWDWEILYCTEEIFDCMSGGIPHKHAVDRIIARKTV